MKRREQALLLLRKAAQDEALLDEVLTSDQVSDKIIGFHCQQAAEKILEALLCDAGVRFRKSRVESEPPPPGRFRPQWTSVGFFGASRSSPHRQF